MNDVRLWFVVIIMLLHKKKKHVPDLFKQKLTDPVTVYTFPLFHSINPLLLTLRNLHRN